MSEEPLHRYESGPLTVEWRPTRCIHSANCVRALPLVFDPSRRPWIDAAAADVEAIGRAVSGCPSGALQARWRDRADEGPDVPTTVVAAPDGPLHVRGDVEVRAPDGTLLRHDPRFALCGCGRSASRPFCDATCRSHA